MGYLQYEHFKNFKLAKMCFEMACQKYKALERRTSSINPILMKLAEIAFQEFDYRRSEELVDSIIHRATGPSYVGNLIEELKNAEIFAYIMKSFFLSMRGEYEAS